MNNATNKDLKDGILPDEWEEYTIRIKKDHEWPNHGTDIEFNGMRYRRADLCTPAIADGVGVGFPHPDFIEEIAGLHHNYLHEGLHCFSMRRLVEFAEAIWQLGFSEAYNENTRQEQILLDAVKFYARKDHWMSPTEDGESRLLIAHGQSIFPEGWAEAHGALQAYAIAKHYESTPPQAATDEVQS